MSVGKIIEFVDQVSGQMSLFVPSGTLLAFGLVEGRFERWYLVTIFLACRPATCISTSVYC